MCVISTFRILSMLTGVVVSYK